MAAIERGEYRLKKDAIQDGETIQIENSDSGSTEDSVEDRLEELQKLCPKGLITDEEYKRARSQILEDL